MNEVENKISPLETVARYIFNEKHYAATTGRVKYPTFIPRNGATSVFRIINLTCEQIWDMGEYVGSIGNRTLRARGDIGAGDIFAEDLKIEPDTQKHLLHANIIGWPSHKGKIKLLAIKLAEKAQLYLKTS